MGMWPGNDGKRQPEDWTPKGDSRPKYVVPRGVKCAIRDIRSGDWRPFVTTKETGFERYERYDRQDEGSFYEFRLGAWLILVHRKYVVHRETVDELEKRLRTWPATKPKKPKRRKRS